MNHFSTDITNQKADQHIFCQGETRIKCCVRLCILGPKNIPEGTSNDPEARLEAAVIALKTEQVQFHIPLFPRADCEFLRPSKHSKNWCTLQDTT